jgi:hypothetical protein
MDVILVSFEELISDDMFGNVTFVRINDTIAIEIKSFCKFVIILRDIAIAILRERAEKREEEEEEEEEEGEKGKWRAKEVAGKGREAGIG